MFGSAGFLHSRMEQSFLPDVVPEVALAEVRRVAPTVPVIHREARLVLLLINGDGGEVLHVGAAALVLRHTRSYTPRSWGAEGLINNIMIISDIWCSSN